MYAPGHHTTRGNGADRQAGTLLGARDTAEMSNKRPDRPIGYCPPFWGAKLDSRLTANQESSSLNPNSGHDKSDEVSEGYHDYDNKIENHVRNDRERERY